MLDVHLWGMNLCSTYNTQIKIDKLFLKCTIMKTVHERDKSINSQNHNSLFDALFPWKM